MEVASLRLDTPTLRLRVGWGTRVGGDGKLQVLHFVQDDNESIGSSLASSDLARDVAIFGGEV